MYKSLVLGCLVLVGTAWGEGASPDQEAFFTEKVHPILLSNCVDCHGAFKQKGNLRLDQADAVLKGGEAGPALVAGNADASLLIQAIEQSGDLKMPPEGKLKDEEIAVLREWVTAGAAWPGGVEIKAPESKKKVISASAAKMEAKSTKKGAEKPIVMAKLEVRPVGEGDVNFSRDIRPILSEHCFACHGPDEEAISGGLRLDLEEEAYKALQSGGHAIVPGDTQKSLLLERMTTEDADDRMPPVELEKVIKQEEIDLLVRWIEQGAAWSGHWSFTKPVKVAQPEVSKPDWVSNEIDSFVLAQLDKEGVTPSAEADKRTLIRRASLDLTGLPPTLDEVNAFLEDDSPDAYEKVLDRLLASPRYGEHLARFWLDAARYADTNGYHIDNERYMWPWRDWVINAYNDNMPFDQFTIEQLAGDMLENATVSQKVATGFNRNHMINFEGGAIPEEYYNAYMVDRVSTFSTIWLGLTMNCAQCHDHKYDPISTRDFYSLYSFFNNVNEKGLDGNNGNSVPFMKVPSADQEVQLAALVESISDTRKAMRAPMPEVDQAQEAWVAETREAVQSRWELAKVDTVTSTAETPFAVLDDGSVLAGGDVPAKDVYEVSFNTEQRGIMAVRLEALLDESLSTQGPGRAVNGNFVLTGIELEVAPKDKPDEFRPVKFIRATASYEQPDYPVEGALNPADAGTGWGIHWLDEGGDEARTAVFVTERPVGTLNGSVIRVRLRHESGHSGHSIGRFRISLSNDKALRPATLGDWYTNGPFKAEDGDTAYATAYEPETGDLSAEPDLDGVTDEGRWKWLPAKHYQDGRIEQLPGGTSAIYLYRSIRASTARRMTLSLGSNDAIKLWLNGEVVHDNKVQRQVEADQDQVVLDLQEGKNHLYMKVVDYGGSHGFYFRNADEEFGFVPAEIEAILAKDEKPRGKARVTLRDYYRGLHSDEYKGLQAELAKLEGEKTALENAIPTTMVMEEMETPKTMFVLHRGEYDQQREEVDTRTPEALHTLADGLDVNRLGLAKWVVDRENPLTSRVVVNRIWQRLFGTGIVSTPEDFGAQGAWPTHPELLDWLAVDFQDMGWDLKAFQKKILMSSTYRQSSRGNKEAIAKDPENRMLARGPRFRLDAEAIRDNALAISGLLRDQIGGPSVRPYQPPGLWKEVAYGASFTAQVFKQDEGDALYRRSMYTFWKRQSPPPGMMIFDAPNREACIVQRSRSNTPLQALALLNDPQYVEAARFLAQRVLQAPMTSPEERLGMAFELATSRRPSEAEEGVLMRIYDAQRERFAADNDAAKAFLAVGDAPYDVSLAVDDLAAWTTVTSMILNLDETITKG